MRIAINTFALSGRRGMAGVGRYITGLAHGLAQIDHPHEVHYLCNEDNAYLFPSRHIMCGKLTETRLLRLMWEQTLLPLQLLHKQIDLYHAPTFVLPQVTVRPSVVTVLDMTWFTHGEKHIPYKRWYFTKLIPRSVSKSARVIAISEATKSEIIRILGVSPDKITVTHMGVDTAVFYPIVDRSSLSNVLAKYGITATGYILYLGKIEPRKNLPALLAAYASVKAHLNSRKLVICGGKGWDFEDVFVTVERLGLQQDVIFTGHVPDSDLSTLYNGSDLFVYPSKYEGFGIPLLEAMACGVPVVSNNVSSMPEVVGDAGILTNCDDVSTLADTIHGVLDNGDLRRSLRERGLARVRQFTWAETACRTIKVYEEVDRAIRAGRPS
jgi:glycosyltransferase involved in cell wall biosynthesis